MDKTVYPHTKPVFVQSVDLIVRDLEGVSRYYERVIGLEVLESGAKGRILGAGGEALLTLHLDANAEPSPRQAAGLFHTAFLLPERRDFAHFLKHVVENRTPVVGVADHLVSEALYLADPEGNGIEVYADRPVDAWTFDAEGVVLETKALDTRGLLAAAPDEPWRRLPPGTALGHLHLQVGQIARAEEFYADVMGLDIMERLPGASFFASGDYHHHLAANIWNSRHAIPRRDGMAGLQGYTLRFNDGERLKKTLAALEDLEIPVKNGPTGKVFRDPWGIGLRLESA
ncbi:MAG: VOC family protein [Acidobacteriota bacterium]